MQKEIITEELFTTTTKILEIKIFRCLEIDQKKFGEKLRIIKE